MGTCRPLPPAPAPLLSLGSAPRQGCHPSRAGARRLEPQPQSRVSGAAAGPQCLLWVPCLTPHPTPRHRPGRGHRRGISCPHISERTPERSTHCCESDPETLDGRRQAPTVVFPREQTRSQNPNRAIVPRSKTVAGSACLGCRPPVGRPGRAGGAVARSPAPAPLCTPWACLWDCRLHIPRPPTQEPSGTQSHVWLEALQQPRAPAILSVSGHVLSPMACGPAPSAVSAVSTHRTARPAANPAPSRARSPGPSAPSRPRGAASPTWPCARALWGTLPVADSQLFSRIPSVCSLQ